MVFKECLLFMGCYVSILKMTSTATSCVNGPILGMFLMGAIFKSANAKVHHKNKCYVFWQPSLGITVDFSQ